MLYESQVKLSWMAVTAGESVHPKIKVRARRPLQCNSGLQIPREVYHICSQACKIRLDICAIFGLRACLVKSAIETFYCHRLLRLPLASTANELLPVPAPPYLTTSCRLKSPSTPTTTAAWGSVPPSPGTICKLHPISYSGIRYSSAETYFGKIPLLLRSKMMGSWSRDDARGELQERREKEG